MNDQLKRRLQGIREILMAHHHAGSLLPDAAKGAEREALVREFLEKVFPEPYRFGRGAVTDATGSISGQLDVVVEFPFLASFPAPGSAQRLYLAESVAFVIEVKSNLSKQWKEVEETVEKISGLRRRWRSHLNVNPEVGISNFSASFSRIPCVAVGFTGYKKTATLRKKLENTPVDRRPDAALVIESGAYVGWEKVEAIAEAGLFAFCTDGSFFARNVLSAEPDVGEYVKARREGSG